MRKHGGLNLDQIEIYKNRQNKFLRKIQCFQNDELKNVAQKSQDQIEFERNKILSENKKYENETYNRKNKSYEVQYKIKRSRKINESRLSKMKIRFQKIQYVQSEIKKMLDELTKDKDKYGQLLEKLIIQGLIKLLEQKVQVKCLAKDFSLVKQILPDCQDKFWSICDIKTQLILSNEKLPDTEIGGIVLTSFVGKIVCSNTLRVRLDYAVQQALPDIRHNLFTAELLNCEVDHDEIKKITQVQQTQTSTNQLI